MKDVFFEDTFHNYRYKVIQGNIEELEFTIVDFPLLNPNDFMNLVKIMTYVD